MFQKSTTVMLLLVTFLFTADSFARTISFSGKSWHTVLNTADVGIFTIMGTNGKWWSTDDSNSIYVSSNPECLHLKFAKRRNKYFYDSTDIDTTNDGRNLYILTWLQNYQYRDSTNESNWWQMLYRRVREDSVWYSVDLESDSIYRYGKFQYDMESCYFNKLSPHVNPAYWIWDGHNGRHDIHPPENYQGNEIDFEFCKFGWQPTYDSLHLYSDTTYLYDTNFTTPLSCTVQPIGGPNFSLLGTTGPWADSTRWNYLNETRFYERNKSSYPPYTGDPANCPSTHSFIYKPDSVFFKSKWRGALSDSSTWSYPKPYPYPNNTTWRQGWAEDRSTSPYLWYPSSSMLVPKCGDDTRARISIGQFGTHWVQEGEVVHNDTTYYPWQDTHTIPYLLFGDNNVDSIELVTSQFLWTGIPDLSFSDTVGAPWPWTTQAWTPDPNNVTWSSPVVMSPLSSLTGYQTLSDSMMIAGQGDKYVWWAMHNIGTATIPSGSGIVNKLLIDEGVVESETLNDALPIGGQVYYHQLCNNYLPEGPHHIRVVADSTSQLADELRKTNNSYNRDIYVYPPSTIDSLRRTNACANDTWVKNVCDVIIMKIDDTHFYAYALCKSFSGSYLYILRYDVSSPDPTTESSLSQVSGYFVQNSIMGTSGRMAIQNTTDGGYIWVCSGGHGISRFPINSNDGSIGTPIIESFPSPATVNDIFVLNERVYAAFEQNGTGYLYEIAVSGGDIICHDITTSSGNFTKAAGRDNKIAVINENGEASCCNVYQENPTPNGTLTSLYSISGYFKDVDIESDSIYLAGPAYSGDVVSGSAIYKYGIPQGTQQPALLSTLPYTPTFHDIQDINVSHSYAYISDKYSGLKVIDLRPREIVENGSIVESGWSSQCNTVFQYPNGSFIFDLIKNGFDGTARIRISKAERPLVDSPNGGEFISGGSIPITWNGYSSEADPVSQSHVTVTIALDARNPNAWAQTTTFYNIDNTGSSSLTPTTPVGFSNYAKIAIQLEDPPYTADTSDGFFTYGSTVLPYADPIHDCYINNVVTVPAGQTVTIDTNAQIIFSDSGKIIVPNGSTLNFTHVNGSMTTVNCPTLSSPESWSAIIVQPGGQVTGKHVRFVNLPCAIQCDSGVVQLDSVSFDTCETAVKLNKALNSWVNYSSFSVDSQAIVATGNSYLDISNCTFNQISGKAVSNDSSHIDLTNVGFTQTGMSLFDTLGIFTVNGLDTFDNIYICSSGTIDIENDATLCFTPRSRLVSNGTIDATAENGHPILFQALYSDPDSAWGGIFDSTGILQMDYCTVLDASPYCVYAETPSGTGTPVTIHNSVIDGSKAVDGIALRLWNSPELTQEVCNTIVQNAYTTGMYLFNCNVYFDHDTIRDCSAVNTYLKQVTGDFTNCEFSGRTSYYAVLCGVPTCTPNFKCCTFQNLAPTSGSWPSTIYCTEGTQPTFGIAYNNTGVSNVIADTSDFLMIFEGSGPWPIVDNSSGGGGNEWYQHDPNGQFIQWKNYTTPYYYCGGQYWNSTPTFDPAGYFDTYGAVTQSYGCCSYWDELNSFDFTAWDKFSMALRFERNHQYADAFAIFDTLATTAFDSTLRWHAATHLVTTACRLNVNDSWIPSLIDSLITAQDTSYNSYLFGHRLLTCYLMNKHRYTEAINNCTSLLNHGLTFRDSVYVAIDLVGVQLAAGLIQYTGGNQLMNVSSIPTNLQVNSDKHGLAIENNLFALLGTGSPKSDGIRLPTTYKLYQNYPNPFNPTTQIGFDLPKASHVELKVYNSLGQLVTTLVNESRPAGSYRTLWNSRNVASGMYIYQLKAGNYISTKKMIRLK